MQSSLYQFEYDAEVFRFICNRSQLQIGKTLVIQRETCKIKEYSEKLPPLVKSKKVPIHLIMGILTVRGEPFLILVKQVQKVGTIVSETIYQIRQIVFIAFRKGYNERSYDYSETVKDLDAIKQNIINDNFYFCYNYNITLSTQKRYQEASTQQMFFWNQAMLHQFRRYEISNCWMVPVVQGYVKGFKFKIKDSVYSYTLISRRSKFQSGTRYTSRGVNEEGYVANYVECQEIYCLNKVAISWVLLRGSVPLFWSQTGIGAQMKVIDSGAQKNILKKHFKMLQNDYSGKITVVDLLSNKPGGVVSQNQLQKKYEILFKQLSQGSIYINFDLNDEISKSKKDVQGVIDRWVQNNSDKLCGDFFAFGYNSNSLMKVQNKFLRVNCLDCLDRTNVICFKSSQLMLRLLEQFVNQSNTEDQKFAFSNDFKQRHREAWLETGDKISIIYSGTTSVASYLTRGEKSNNLFNNLGNKLKSLNRFYNANVNDGYKQQCIDWVLRTSEDSKIPYFQMNIRKKLNEAEYCQLEEIMLGIITWNCAQVSPSELDLGLLLELPQTPGILIICLQEVVELSTYNVLLGGSKGSQNKWIQSIERLMHLQNKKMIFVGWKDMVGVLSMMFVGEEHFEHLSSVIWSQVKTGWKGNLGNKGSVALSFKYDDSVITILNSHLEAGEGKIQERLLNIEAIHTSCFPIRNEHQQYENTEFRFLVGDLNFRIDLNSQQIKNALYHIQKEQKNSNVKIEQLLEPLLAVDQLLYCKAKQKDEFLNQYKEAPIRFLPTYKYIKKSNQYDFKRVPSWCDRILYKSNPLKTIVKQYNTKNSIMNSDHKPVFGIFNLLVKKEDYQKRQMLQDVFVKQ